MVNVLKNTACFAYKLIRTIKTCLLYSCITFKASRTFNIT